MPTSYEIYLDESGSFEKPEDNPGSNHVCLIGGILVPEALKKQENRLRQELKMQIGEKYFPGLSSVTRIHVSDRDLAGKQRTALRQDLGEFFQKNMADARIAFIYSRNELEEKKPSGPQFYRSMLLNLIKTLVFYSTDFGDRDSFHINLAHRRVEYLVAMRDDLLAKGYLKLKDKKGKIDVSAITEADVNAIMKLLKDSLNFICQRSDSYCIKPFAAWDNPFMVMADWICNTLSYIIGVHPDGEQLDAEISGKFAGRILFYGQDDYDFPFTLLSHFFREEPDKFISEYLSLANSRDARHRYSDKYLIYPALLKVVREQLVRVDDPKVFTNIIALAEDFLLNKDFSRLGDILGLIISVKPKMEDIADGNADSTWDPIAYRYHDVCLRYYNHSSDTVNALIHKDKGIKIFRRLSSTPEITQQRQLHELINRYSVCDTNEFAFARAIDTLQAIKETEEKLLDIFHPARNEILGKIYGSMGQNYAFMGNNEEAAAHFERANYHLGGKNPIQAVYRAYLAVQTGNADSYRHELAFLFHKDSFPGYYFLIDECLSNLSSHYFQFHLLLKGLLIFPNENSEMERIMQTIMKSTKRFSGYDKVHPWQMIYTVLGRLMAQWSQLDQARDCWKKAANFTKDKNQHTFWMMGDAARAWHAIFELQQGNAGDAIKLLSHIFETFRELKTTNRAIGTFNPNSIADRDEKVRGGWFDRIGAKFLENYLPDADNEKLIFLCQEFSERFTFSYW